MVFFELLWAYILIFLLAAVPFIEALVIIPIAIIAGLNPLIVLTFGIIGNVLTLLLVIIFVDEIKKWRNRRKLKQASEGTDVRSDSDGLVEGVDELEYEDDTPNKRTLRARKLWNKYGLPGLAILGPFFVGSHLTAFLSLTLGGTKQRVTVWIILSVVLWSVLFAVLAILGIDFINTEDSRFFDRFQS